MAGMFDYLPYIYSVYQESSFSRAAEKMYISQSSLSLTVKKAEQEIGAEIFNRKAKPLELTDFGKHYISACEHVMALQSELENYIYDSNHLKRGTLSIGSGNFLLTYYVAPVVAKFKEIYPNIDITLIEGRSQDLKSQLEKGTLDLFISNADFTESKLNRDIVQKEHLLFVVPKSLSPDIDFSSCICTQDELKTGAFLAKKAISLTSFEEIPFVGLRSGNDSRIRADQIFASEHIHPRYLMQLDQSSTAFIISSRGSGSCIIADTVIRNLWTHQNLYVFRLNHPAAIREISIYTSSQKYQTVAMQAIIQLFHDMKHIF